MGLFKGIGKVFSGIGKALSGLGSLTKVFGGLLNSPLGGLLKMAFPPLGFAQGILSFAGMMGSLSNGIGGGQNY